MTPEQAESFRYNVLDLTKVWPHGEFPLRPIGKLVLNENPQNYFAEIEQVRYTLGPCVIKNTKILICCPPGCLLAVALGTLHRGVR